MTRRRPAQPRVCPINGVWGSAVFNKRFLSNRPAKVIANALRAGFHLITQRALPPPVGSSDRVTRYRHFSAAASFGKCPRALTARR